MNAFEGVIDDFDTQVLASIEQKAEPIEEMFQNIDRLFKNINLAVELYKTTGIAPKCNFGSSETFEVLKEDDSASNNSERSSLKENIQPDENGENKEEVSIKSGRPRRNAFKEASENINRQYNLSSVKKLRRPDNCSEIENIYIKKEKISISSGESDVSEVKIKTESEEMPAPTRRAPRTKGRKKTEKVKVKVEKIDEDLEKETAEVVQPPQVSDADKTKGKRSRSFSPDEEKAEKRTKSPDVNAQNNATYISESSNKEQAPIMNATVMVEDPKCVNNNNLVAPVTDDMMTDDESEEETGAKVLMKTITKSVKQIFSPFEPSPVKKKIEAFEKLKDNGPVRVTRTKTKAQEKEQEQEVKSNVKEKAKFFTPETANRFIPAASSSTTRANRLKTSSNQSLLGKSSAQKQQYTYKEREKKEQEALKKRDALLQAQKEEKRRKREEKQLKAQQQREALEKEKLKALEAQRLKDERHRQLLAEQELKKQKQKEELEKKRLMAKLKAVEEKRKEEARRLEEQRKVDEIAAKLAKQDEEMAKLVQKQKQKQQVPVYMTTKEPMLPTDDCYDSDDEEYNKHAKVMEASWARGTTLKLGQVCIIAAGDTVKNTFFSRQAQTPDLQEIFEVIQPDKLKRSSSATWHKAPRFTMMPKY